MTMADWQPCIRLGLIVGLAMLAGCTQPVATPETVPAVTGWEQAQGRVALPDALKITVQAPAETALGPIVVDFHKDFLQVAQDQPAITSRIHESAELTVALDNTLDKLGDEGYRLEIDDSLSLSARTPRGVFYGLQTILQLRKQNNPVSRGVITDVPAYSERGVMLDVVGFYLTVDELEAVIRQLAWNKMNMLHLHLADDRGFRLQSDKFPDLTSERHYSKADIRRLQDYASGYQVTIIPEIDLPSHAGHIIRYKPDLAFRCPSMRTSHKVTANFSAHESARTIDITRTEVREWTMELLREFIPLFDGPYFHTGGDEYAYDVNKYACPELMEYMQEKGYEYPGDVFVEYANELNALVRSFGKTTQMWNWWRFSPDKNKDVEPQRLNQTSLQPDKNIVINIWNHSRQADILADGYRAIITSEEGPEALYVTPGDGTLQRGDYGYFDSERIYEQWSPLRHPGVAGFKVCVWALDDDGNRDFAWLKQQIDLPVSVLAQKAWGSPERDNLDSFVELIGLVGHSVTPATEY